MRIFKKKRTAKSYEGKKISFYPYRAGFGLIKSDFQTAKVEKVFGETVFLTEVQHKTLGRIGNSVLPFYEMRIIDERAD